MHAGSCLWGVVALCSVNVSQWRSATGTELTGSGFSLSVTTQQIGFRSELNNGDFRVRWGGVFLRLYVIYQ